MLATYNDACVALKWVSPDTAPPIPWQRVLASNGSISSRGPGTNGAQRQKEALEAEGVEVTVSRSGELHVDLGAWGWFPAPGTIDFGSANADAPEEQSSD